MRRLLYLILLTSCLLPVSCRRAVENARQNIRIEQVERIERLGLTGAEAVLRVKNDTRHKLRLDEAEAGVYLGDSRVGTFCLNEPVEVGRRTTVSVTTRWQVKIADPLALYALSRKLARGDDAQVFISLRIVGRGGPAAVNISRERMTLSEFLNTFGVTLHDLKLN